MVSEPSSHDRVSERLGRACASAGGSCTGPAGTARSAEVIAWMVAGFVAGMTWIERRRQWK